MILNSSSAEPDSMSGICDILSGSKRFANEQVFEHVALMRMCTIRDSYI